MDAMSSGRSGRSRASRGLRNLLGNGQIVLPILAILVGAAAGAAIVLVREWLILMPMAFPGFAVHRVLLHVHELPWWWLVLTPATGALVIGSRTHHVEADGAEPVAAVAQPA